jgi:hypothetical protein
MFAGVNSFMNPLMMAGAMRGGQSEMMKMMTLMKVDVKHQSKSINQSISKFVLECGQLYYN